MKKIILLTLSIIILSCNTNDDVTNETDYSEYISENQIDTEINFMPQEVYNNNEQETPSLKLKLISTEIFPCINYSILTTQFTRNDELIVRFDEIGDIEICLTALGPTISFIDLPKNISKITFLNGDIIDQYSVEITEDTISITLIESTFTSSLYDKTFLIPENSFAYLCGTNVDNTDIYTDFSEIIESNSDFKEFTFEGEGRIPYPETTDGFWVNHPAKYYTYSNQEEFDTLANVLNEYSSENIEPNSGASITIYNWNNRKLYSGIEN